MAGKARDRRRKNHKRNKMPTQIKNPEIRIVLDMTTGQISYNGPADMLMFYGMLEFTKADLITKATLAEKNPQPKVVIPSIVPPKL